MNLEEDSVRQALRALSDQTLARSAGGDSRVAKYEHRLAEMFNFTRPEAAILCELLLRGPQTPGELRSRAGRMHPFEDLNVVHTALRHLIEREPPLVALLPRQAGTKEARYAHLLSPIGVILEKQSIQPFREPVQSNHPSDAERTLRLQMDVADLQNEIADLKRQFAEFRKQFE
jgi:uncharacterized protein